MQRRISRLIITVTVWGDRGLRWLAEQIGSDLIPGVHFLPGGINLVDAAEAASSMDLRCCYINGRAVRTSTDFFEAIAVALDLPAYFGRNWDALYDCISDLDVGPFEGYLVIYEGAEEFARSDSDGFRMALESFQSAVEHCIDIDVPMYVLVEAAPLKRRRG